MSAAATGDYSAATPKNSAASTVTPHHPRQSQTSRDPCPHHQRGRPQRPPHHQRSRLLPQCPRHHQRSRPQRPPHHQRSRLLPQCPRRHQRSRPLLHCPPRRPRARIRKPGHRGPPAHASTPHPSPPPRPRPGRRPRKEFNRRAATDDIQCRPLREDNNSTAKTTVVTKHMFMSTITRDSFTRKRLGHRRQALSLRWAAWTHATRLKLIVKVARGDGGSSARPRDPSRS